MGDALVAPPEELHIFGETLQRKTTGAQLFDKNSAVIGLLNADGTINRLEGYHTTDFIPVNEGQKIYCSQTKSVRGKYFDEDRSAIQVETSEDFSFNNGGGITIPNGVSYIRFSINDNVIDTVMLNNGETALPWEPYTGGKPSPSPEYPQDIVNIQPPVQVEVMGKNFLPYGDGVLEIGIPHKARGRTYILNNDGSITITTQDSSQSTDSIMIFNPDAPYKLKPAKYAVETFDNNVTMTVQICDASGNNIRTADSSTKFFLINEGEYIKYVWLYGKAGEVWNTTIYPQIEYNEVTLYEPYKQPQTITFNTPGGLPGIPVNSNGNYTDAEGQQWLSDSIEYKNEKLMYVQRVETLRLLSDVGSIDSQNGYLNINNFLNADITRRSGSLCTHLTYGDTRGDNVFWIDSNGTGVRIKISKYTTSEEYLSWLAENEVYLTYPCANPIEKEISDPNLINQLKSLRLNSPNTTIVNDANAFQKLKYLKETFTMANVNFRFGTYEQYKAVASKDTNTLYFVDGVIYKGDAPYSQKVEMVSAFPDTANAAQGILYVNSSTYEAKFFNGTDFTTVFVGTVGNMDDAGNDNKVVTQAAVKAYVTKQLADANIPTDSAINEKINTAKEEAITEAVSDATTKANQALTDAKAYTDQKNSAMDTRMKAVEAAVTWGEIA